METMDRQLRYFICIAELGSLSARPTRWTRPNRD